MCLPWWPHMKAFTHKAYFFSMATHADKEPQPLFLPLKREERKHTSLVGSLAHCNYLLTDENRMSYLSRNIFSLSTAYIHTHTHMLSDAAPRAGRPLHLPHLLCPQLNFDQPFQRHRLVCASCVFTEERLHIHVYAIKNPLSIGVWYNCIYPPALD
ncbi:hypothetical protein GOODEAATRI_022284 [Goodea atripinnis]|uniref:Uncharacterized protein n=1 Tax=Goodea atripinnis TaxID=208336 RepID=A0ABV0Q0S6_9TELE